MPGLPSGEISKGSVLLKMDEKIKEWIANGNLPQLDSFREALIQQLDYLSTLQEYVPAVTDDEVRYLRKYWYDPTNKYCFWFGTDLGPIVRYGKAEALRLARQHTPTLPVESYWEPVASTEFKFIIIPSAQQITAILRTPTPEVRAPYDPPQPHPSKVPVWVVERNVNKAPIQTRNIQDI